MIKEDFAKQYLALREQGKSDKDIIEIMGTNHTTFYRHKKRVKENGYNEVTVYKRIDRLDALEARVEALESIIRKAGL